MNLRLLLNQVGLDAKESAVYLSLLTSGPSSFRHLAEATRLDRTRILKAVRSLQRQGLTSTFQKHKKEFHQAEDPERLIEAIERRERELGSVRRQVAELMPEVRQLYAQSGSRPTVRYFEGGKGAAIVLKEILQTVSQLSEKSYRAYSSAAVRERLYNEFPKFTKERIDRKIRVRVIGLAAVGQHRQPMAEHRWIESGSDTGTYVIVFGPKVAFFTLGADDGQPRATVIENDGLAAAQRLIFDQLWVKLG